MMKTGCVPHPLDRRCRPGILQATAFMLAVYLCMPFAPAPLAASTRPANVSGRVLSADGKAPAPGAVLKAVHIISQRIYTSQPSDPSGHFDLSDLPAGYYDIGIESGGQLFVAGSVVNLSEGGKISLDLILQPYGDKTSEWWQGQKREIPILGQEQGVAKVLEKSRAAGGGKSFWKKPGGIAIICVGGAGAIAAAAGGGSGGSSGSQASPSSP